MLADTVQHAADVGAITKTNLSLKLSPDRRYLELFMGHKKNYFIALKDNPRYDATEVAGLIDHFTEQDIEI